MRLRLVSSIFPALVVALCLGLIVSSGCAKKEEKEKGSQTKAPVFKLAWSEYPSWSVFGVASELNLINGKEGEQGALEKKWGVDIVLEELAYDPCIQAYGSKSVDAVCVTNIDVLDPAMKGRKSVAIMPTSTSVGADACLVLRSVIKNVPDDPKKDRTALKKAVVQLRKHKVYGLAKSVSEYAFDRNLELLNEKPDDYKFSGEDPQTAAQAMAAKQKDHVAIMVWNPFVLTAERKNTDAKRLFDSSTIPEEIIDMVVVAQESLDKEKGKDFACCVIECYYEFNKKLEDPKERDKLLMKLGEKFGKLPLEDMKRCVKETRFYKTPKEGLKLFEGEKLPESMKLVARFCKDKEMIKKEASYGFGTKDKAPDAMLRFDPSYIKALGEED